MAGPGLASYQTTIGLWIAFCVLLLTNPSSSAGALINAAPFLLLTPPAARGNLTINNVLLTAERIHSGQINIPHSYVILGDDVYAATANGLVVNVAPCRPIVIANLRPRGCYTLQRCGHLVSIKLSSDNLLIVLDAYRGVFEVHPVTGVTRHLFDSRTAVNGRASIYLNDLVIMKDGTIVMSDSGSRFTYDNEFWIRFEGRADGRLVGFNPKTGQLKEILSGLAYPTGLEISNDGHSLLVSEASRVRLLRLELRKEKLFQRSYVNINLPGMPEHIRKSGRGTYWIGLSYPRFQGEPSFLDQYSKNYEARNFLAKQRTKEELQLLSKRWGLAVEIDDTGKILRSIHDPSGRKVSEVLEVTEYSGVLHVGTRSQHASVRVIGAPSELTVDSLVQVLRGRCKVFEDQVAVTKASLRQQLKGNQTKEHQQKTTTKPANIKPQPQTYGITSASATTEKPRQIINLKSLSKGLFQLHRTLLNAGVDNKKLPPALPQPSQTSSPSPATIPQQVQVSNKTSGYRPTVNTQSTVPPSIGWNTTTTQSPQNSPEQTTDGLSNTKPFENNASSTNPPTTSTQSPVLSNINVGNISTAILNTTTQESVPGQMTRQQIPQIHPVQVSNEPRTSAQSFNTYTGTIQTSAQSSHAYTGTIQTSAQSSHPYSGTIQTSAQSSHPYTDTIQTRVTKFPMEHMYITEKQNTPEYAMETTTPVGKNRDMNDLGGFMGFLGNSAFQNGALVTSGDQIGQQDPFAAFSLPDPGHIEPGLATHQGLSTYKDQFLPGMDSSLNFEQLPEPLDQESGKQASENGTMTNSPNRNQQQEQTGGETGVQKRPDISLQDISIKDANAIQNMQMFHPTDRPEQLIQSQNTGSTNTMSSFQQDTLSEQLQQHQQNYHNPQQSETYAFMQSDQPNPPQVNNKRTSFQQYTDSYDQKQINSPAAGTTMNDHPHAPHLSLNSQNGGFDPGAPLNQNPGAPLHQSFTLENINDRSPNLYPSTGNNSTDMNNPFLTSGAAVIHHHQPFTDALVKDHHNNQAWNITRLGYDITDTNDTAQKNPNELPVAQQTSKRFLNKENISQSSAPDHMLLMNSQASVPTSNHSGAVPGYIKLPRGPGQYILIPLSQKSLLQALSRISRPPEQNGQRAVSLAPH